ncbi:MAG: acetyl-CoA carboxylase biotin carboxylase subunit [Ignavibacteria bacterium]|nr:acetyl-CoA carboxylase biotin carboxylase subunit [Ignavibacteria bacterium]
MFKKILIANRGEIAIRIIRACKDLGIQPVAVYSDADKNSLHVRLAGEAIHIGASQSKDSYLNFEQIVDAAKISNCEAIHPGYGFLSENPDFIKYVCDRDLVFIGPSADSVRLMGNKASARDLMIKHNVPVVPGTKDPIQSKDELKSIVNSIGYPILLKATSGGGGKGMRVVHDESELYSSFEMAQSEAEKSFKDKNVYVEKYLTNPKHIEIQIIADHFGNYVHLFERECSIQRRHQKIIEEAPSPTVDDELRKKITLSAIQAAKACNYTNAGTIEFLVDSDKNFYFLEMNTRVQVEHPVTEFITGIDIVREQIKIAAGEKLSFTQDQLKINGSSIEVRIYAEDPFNNFMPSFGKISHYRVSGGFGVRIDSGIDMGSEVPIYYDPILAKVVTWGINRNEAIARMERVLREIQIVGLVTNIPLCLWILNEPEFIENKFDTQYLSNKFQENGNGHWIKGDEKILDLVSKTISYCNSKRNSAQKNTSNSFTVKSNWIKRRFED